MLLSLILMGEARNSTGDSLQLGREPMRSQICWMAALRSSSCRRSSFSTRSLKRRNSSFSSRTTSKSSLLNTAFCRSASMVLIAFGLPTDSSSASGGRVLMVIFFSNLLLSLLLERSLDSPRMAAKAYSSWEQLLLRFLMSDFEVGSLVASRAGENLLGSSLLAPKMRDSEGFSLRTACFQLDLDSDLLDYISLLK